MYCCCLRFFCVSIIHSPYPIIHSSCASLPSRTVQLATNVAVALGFAARVKMKTEKKKRKSRNDNSMEINQTIIFEKREYTQTRRTNWRKQTFCGSKAINIYATNFTGLRESQQGGWRSGFVCWWASWINLGCDCSHKHTNISVSAPCFGGMTEERMEKIKKPRRRWILVLFDYR